MKNIIKIISFLSVFLFCSYTSEAFSPLQLQEMLKESPHWELSLLHARDLQQEGNAIFVDIRSKESYEKGHAPGAINLPLPSLPQTLLENPGMLPKDLPIYVICCAQDRNALFATLPLRMAGYEAYNVTGGGVDAWIYLGFSTEEGSAQEPKKEWSTSLSSDERVALSAINPSYHMMKAGRSYLINREKMESFIDQGNNLFVVEVFSESQTTISSYVKEKTLLSTLLTENWLKGHPKEESIYLIGENDKELVLGVVALRMLGYDAVAAVWK